MAYDPGAIDATLAAAVGEDPQLIAELRRAFIESAERCIQAMRAAESAEAWRGAGMRLKGLAASFGAVRLMALAEEVAAAPHDMRLVARVERALARF